MKPHWHGRYFNLLEMVFGIFLAGVVLIAAYYGVIFMVSETHEGREKVGLQRDADIAAYWIELTVREGSWAWLDTSDDDSLVVQNFAAGWQRRIYADGNSLMIDSGSGGEEIVSTLSSIHFYPYSARVEYELEVQDEEGRFALNSSKSLRNVQYRGVWHFSEGGGEVTYDDSPFNNSAGIYGASWTTGPLDSALAFDGQDDRLWIPDNPDLEPDQRLGFGALMRLSSTATQTIFNRHAEAAAQGFMHLYIDGGRISYAFSNGGSVVRTSSSSLSWTSGQWYEIAVQHDTITGRVHFYRDGVRVGAASTSGFLAATSGDGWIGRYQDSQYPLHGALDELTYLNF